MKTSRFPWGLTITTIVAFAILISLGVWQLYRLEWKQGVLARRAALENAAPQPLDKVLAAAADPAMLDMVRITVTCPGLAKAPTQRVFSLSDGDIVNRLVSACPMAGSAYSAILVDRGHTPDGVEGPPLVDATDIQPVAITGVLRRPLKPNLITRLITPAPKAPPAGASRLWMDYDLPGIAAALGVARPAPVLIAAETSSNPDWPELKPGLSTEAIPNNHLQYAFTWFGLAVVLLSIYAAMLRRRLKGL